MTALFRRIAATLSLLALFSSVPLSFVHAQQAKRVLIIGDSQSVNLMSSGNLGTKLSQQGITVAGNYTKVCWGVSTMLNGLSNPSNSNCSSGGPVSSFLDAQSGTFDAIVVFLGGNDCGGSPCPSDYGSKIDQLITQLQGKTSNIIWFGPTYFENATNHVRSREFLNGYLPSRVAHYEDLWSLTQPLTRPAGDVHFSRTDANGYPKFADLITPIIASHIQTSENTSTTENTAAAPPVTDTLGRTQEDVNRSIAARCADTNPVFPVSLGISIGGVSQVNGLTEYINVVYRYLTSIVLVVAIVMVTYGGFRYLVSATPLGVSDGKDIIKNGIVGMVLVLGAYVILNTINPATTILQFTRPPVDIVCRNFEANFGTQGTGASFGANVSGSISAASRAANEFDPLNLRNTYELPANGHDVANHCNETLGNDDCAEGQECVDLLPLIKALNNTNYTGNNEEQVDSSSSAFSQIVQYISSENKAEICSDGKDLYDGCDVQDECKNGLVCQMNWKLCIKAHDNEEGSPCYFDSDSENNGSCATGLRCVTRETNSPYPESYLRRGLKVCTKVVNVLQNSEIQAFNNGIIDPSKTCKYHRECGTDDDRARCVGSAISPGIRACVTEVSELNGKACGNLQRANGGSTTYPCNGNNGYTCAFCPGTGSRVWTSITGQGANYIGQCKPNAQSGGGQSEGRIGDNCAGS